MRIESTILLIGAALLARQPPVVPAAERPDIRAMIESQTRHIEEKAASAGLAPDDLRSAAVSGAKFDVLHYDLDLTVDPTDSTLSGAVSILAQILDATADSFVCDLHDNMDVIDVLTDSFRGGYSHQGNRIAVALPPKAAGGTLRVDISYSGRPEVLGFGSFVFTRHGQGEQAFPGAFSLSEPWFASTWWPCVDRPDDKATARVTLTVPSGWTAVSNGRMVIPPENLPSGDLRFTWAEDYPIATYLVSVAATNYESFHEVHTDLDGRDIDLDFFLYPEHLEQARTDFAGTGAMIDTLASIFGPYPFADEKYGIAEFSFRGGMEHQTVTGLGDRFLTGQDDYRWILVHELAHQWFGDSLTPSGWRDIWLNEGFATYAEALYFERLDGPAALGEFMAGLKLQQFGDTVYDPVELFGVTVYYKGAWVLHMLRRLLGDDAFFAALRLYVDRYSYGNVTTGLFREVCEEVSDRDLGWFFDQWLATGGRPEFRYDWTATAGGESFDLNLTLTQAQGGETVFRLPLDVRVYGPDVALDWTVESSLRSQVFSRTVDFRPDSLRIDPDGWALADFQRVSRIETGGGESLVSGITLKNPYPNPFNGSVSIPLELPARLEISLAIHNLLGQTVREIQRGELGPGSYRIAWDGRDRSGLEVPSGLYFAVLKAPGRRLVRKLVLLK